MSNNFELALRKAVGIELVVANGDPEEPLPSTPIALNDFESLKAIVMHRIKQSAPRKPWQQ